MSYHTAVPDQYLAITGTGVNGIKTTKSSWVWPFQRCFRFSTQPCDYSMNLQAMTKEKLQFLLPVVFTIGPDVHQRRGGADARHNDIPDHDREDRSDSLKKYAMLLAEAEADTDTNKKTSSQFFESTVKGIIEGETRVLVSGMTMEEIFTEREGFKKRLYCNIQSELSQFGLRIFHANVEELHDVPGMELKKDEGILSKLGNAVNATLIHAPKEGLRTKRCTGLKSERRAREEQLEYDRKYLDLGYFPNSNLGDADGHVPSHGGSVEDVVKAIFEEDGWHHHGDGRRPPTRPAHGHGQGSSRLVPVAQRPLAGRSKGNGHRFPPLPAKLMSGLCIMWGLGVPVALAHRIPNWLLHMVGGTTVAAGACVPALQPAEGETKAYRTGAYIAWAVTFAIFITMELYQRQDQRRLLLGLVVFCGANLLGSLAEDSSTTIDSIKNWGPLALSLSLWVVPEWIQLMGARQVVDAVAGA